MKKEEANCKIISFFTNCYVCNLEISKKNSHEGVYLCEDCKSLSSDELYIKIVEETRDILIDDPIFTNKEVLQSILKKNEDEREN